ncbi:MAG: efflux RND transporter periplasmic adaptor subunit [Candidatus Cloacimonetes bacterium]|jgi:HlyD family secretion protein|nr:efflux RND transporter periplasmic adaptor subunit [Candidatus Cloacimonadota bacterium]MCB5286330.1 efflux RND transporter periplasmic adaptor subunit [Candidatus Cloacimonadota bacterium]MCK9184023.1 efflux RND transporter periplasmic adaptor subunit [Candidatus Cloacimonadota bacterium]MCK9583729.1 efflux RND transporter periplasmic adaptor subunit [Candidatus Cloacimonadota bacterium]MDY0228652.1 efflux RND transporter periplasmic adaptor subunit [Candidatus Cloacimonadaceae bacterium]
MKRYIKYIIIVAVLVIAVIAFNKYRKAKSAPEWRVDSPSSGSVREVVTATGSLNPYVLVNVGTEVSGKIERLYKDFNDTVKKGELLAKLDTEILMTSLEASRGDLAKTVTSMQEAKLDYDLLSELNEQDMSPEYEVTKARFKYQTAQQNVANAQLSLQRAEKNLANAHITSPIDGVIVSRDVDEGQTVAASLNSPTLFIIANNLESMQITAKVDEADIGKIKLGLPVEFNVDAYPRESFSGKVQQIRLNPTTESNVVTYSVIIDAANPERKLLPGMTTNVTFIIRAKQDVLRLPETATRFRPSKETWELFGLKWDDELLNAGRTAMQELMAKPPAASDKPATQVGGKPGMGGQRPQGGRGMDGNPGLRIAVVWVLKDNVPSPVAVRTGVSDGAFVELIDGIPEDAVLVTGVIYNDPKQAATNSGMPMRRF